MNKLFVADTWRFVYEKFVILMLHPLRIRKFFEWDLSSVFESPTIVFRLLIIIIIIIDYTKWVSSRVFSSFFRFPFSRIESSVGPPHSLDSETYSPERIYERVYRNRDEPRTEEPGSRKSTRWVRL